CESARQGFPSNCRSIPNHVKCLSNKLLLVVGSTLLGFGACGSISAQTNGVLREVYAGISGTTVADLTNSPSFPDNPTTVQIITDFFEAPINGADNYGQRMSAFLVPPTTG